MIADHWAIDLDDFTLPNFIVHSVESGSAASVEGVCGLEFVETVGGRSFDDLDELYKYLQELKNTNKKAVIKLKEFADAGESYLDYFEISVDVEDLKIIGGHKQ